MQSTIAPATPAFSDLVDALHHVPARVVLLVGLEERGRVRGLETHEDGEEVALPHEPEQFLVLGQVQAGLGGELEGPVLLHEPRAELPQEGLQRPAVPDQVVVHEVDVPAVPERVQGVELPEHLGGGLGPGHPSVQVDDVAELAVERATARVLDPDVQVAVELQEIEAGDRRARDVGETGRREQAALGPGHPGGEEVAQDLLGLPEHPEVGRSVDLGGARGVGAAHHDGLAGRLHGLDDPEGVGLLGQHAARHDQIGPGEVGRVELLDVAVHQPNPPALGEQRRHRDEPQRGCRVPGAQELAGGLVVPERGPPETRVDEQDVPARGFDQEFSWPQLERCTEYHAC
jgi:hypothetical protein